MMGEGRIKNEKKIISFYFFFGGKKQTWMVGFEPTPQGKRMNNC